MSLTKALRFTVTSWQSALHRVDYLRHVLDKIYSMCVYECLGNCCRVVFTVNIKTAMTHTAHFSAEPEDKRRPVLQFRLCSFQDWAGFIDLDWSSVWEDYLVKVLIPAMKGEKAAEFFGCI